MEKMNVTLVQTQQFWEDKQANFNHLDQLLQSIPSTDLILIPEMFHTGFSMNAKELAEEYTESDALKWLQDKVKETHSAIYTSFICRENGMYYNRGVFIYPDGKIVTYDKRKLFTFAKEEEHYTAGSQQKIVEYKGFKILLTICYDLRFPEIQRNKMLNDKEAMYDIALNVANWPSRRNLHWKTLLRARAIENQCIMIGVNRVGKDKNDLDYSGDSAIIDPFGQYLTDIQADKESVTTVEIAQQPLIDVRQKMNFLKDFEE